MIVTKNLTKRFRKLTALNDISVTFSSGECVALLGPNGSGKTTLIKSLLGMVVPNSGTVYFNKKLIAHKWMYRNQVGYMPQIGRYPENMTIAHMIDMMKDIRKADGKKHDEELLTSFGLTGIMNKRMRTLSGGTTQKVSASLAFLFNPDVLILDEPTAGLDPISSELLKQKIIKEKQNGKLILITSHVLSELDDLITEVFYMHEGKLLFQKKLSVLKEETGEQKLSYAIAKIMRDLPA
ncbi:MAG: ABC transporter ATP-binding protein [Ginsengibacter sp.]